MKPSALLASEALRPPVAEAPAATAQDTQVFDAWLRQELSRLYDSALTEPVPDELLRLLQPAMSG
jgi:hypothetical protein